MDTGPRIGKKQLRAVFAGAIVVFLGETALSLWWYEGERGTALVLLLGGAILGGLIYLSYRRQNWARWSAVGALVVSALILVLLAPLIIFVDLLGGFFHLAAALSLFTCAVVMTFSQSVADLIESKAAASSSALWRDAAVTRPIAPALVRRSSSSNDAAIDEEVAGLLDAARKRARIASVTKAITNLILIVAGALLIGVIVVVVAATADMVLESWRSLQAIGGDPASDPGFTPERMVAAFIGIGLLYVPRLMLSGIVYAYLAFFFLPALAVIPITISMVIGWKAPARILLLRPFNLERVTKSLTRLIRREAAPLGHVYSLADMNMRIPWYVRVPLILGQLSFLSFRNRKIRKPIDLHRFRHAIRRRRLRTLNWCMSSSKVFPVACVDQGWKKSVEALLLEVDLVLIDVSALREGIVWELEACHRLGLMSRVVLLAHEDSSENLEARLAKTHVGIVEDNHAPFFYGRPGSEESGALRRRMAETLIANGGPGCIDLAEIPIPAVSITTKLSILATGAAAIVLAVATAVSLPDEVPSTGTLFPPGYASGLDYNADGSLLTFYSEGDLVVWDTGSQEVRTRIDLKHFPNATLSPDGRTIAYGADAFFDQSQDAGVFDAFNTLRIPRNVETIVFGPSGQLVASVTWSSTIGLIDASSMELDESLRLEIGFIDFIAFSPAGNLVAFGARSSILIPEERERVAVYDLSTRSIVHLSTSSLGVDDLEFSPVGRLLAATSDDEIFIWDLDSEGRLLARFGRPGFTLWHFASEMTSSCRTIVIGSPTKLAFSPDGSRLYIADGTAVFEYELATGKTRFLRLQGLSCNYFNDIIVSPDGRSLAAAMRDDGIRVWSLDGTLERNHP